MKNVKWTNSILKCRKDHLRAHKLANKRQQKNEIELKWRIYAVAGRKRRKMNSNKTIKRVDSAILFVILSSL